MKLGCTALAFLAIGCGNVDLTLTMVTPDSSSDDAGLTASSTFDVAIGWGTFDAGVSGVPAGGGFSISVPANTPLDAQVSGEGWRGELHGLVVPAGSSANATILMLPVGQVGSFTSLIGLPPLAGATVSPLDAGLVLVVGGNDAGAAWIWDQSQVGFAAAASTQLTWANHTAIPREGGLFELAGGDFSGTAVELYSPFDGGTVTRDVLPAPERWPGMVYFSDNVLIGCGVDAGEVVGIAQAPLTPNPGCGSGALLSLPDGVVAIGTDAVSPEAGNVPAFPSMRSPRFGFAALPDGDGGLLVTGGFGIQGSPPIAQTTVEDLLPDAGATTLEPMQIPRANHTLLDLTGFGDGFLAVGGIDPRGLEIGSLETLPSNGAPPIPLGTASMRPGVVQIPGYRIVLILSGETADGGPTNGLDLFAIP